MTKDKKFCPTCGAEVKVVGNVTKHYEPVEKELLSEKDFSIKLILFIRQNAFLPENENLAHVMELISRRECEARNNLCGRFLSLESNDATIMMGFILAEVTEIREELNKHIDLK